MQTSAADSLTLTVSSASQLHTANQKDVVTLAEQVLYRNVHLAVKLHTGVENSVLASNKTKVFNTERLLHIELHASTTN